MLNKNVEVFMACEKEAHEADMRRLIRRRLTGPAHGLEAVRSAENLMGSSATVLTRTKIWKIRR